VDLPLVEGMKMKYTGWKATKYKEGSHEWLQPIKKGKKNC
jgi:hypothetical protein